MRIVWVDVCFAINFCADYLICLLAARFCGAPLKRGRYALAALFGGVRYLSARWTDTTASYNIVHSEARYLPPLSVAEPGPPPIKA
jgi:hypothetical protein